MKTLRQLMELCPKVQFDKAKECRILSGKVGLNKADRRTLRAIVQRHSEDGPHDKHRVEIQCTEPNEKLSVGTVRVWCDCGFHSYYGQEYLLTKNDASTIRYTDGSAPNIRNPQMRMFLCHHALRLARAAMTQKL